MPNPPRKSQPDSVAVLPGRKRRFHWAAWVAVGIIAATIFFYNLQTTHARRYYPGPANSNREFYRFENQKGFPANVWLKWEEGWFGDTSTDGTSGKTAAGIEFSWFGLITNVIFLGVTAVFTLLLTDALIRYIPRLWASLRAPRKPPPPDDSSDGEPADPAWDEAKNR